MHAAPRARSLCARMRVCVFYVLLGCCYWSVSQCCLLTAFWAISSVSRGTLRKTALLPDISVHKNPKLTQKVHQSTFLEAKLHFGISENLKVRKYLKNCFWERAWKLGHTNSVRESGKILKGKMCYKLSFGGSIHYIKRWMFIFLNIWEKLGLLCSKNEGFEEVLAMKRKLKVKDSILWDSDCYLKRYSIDQKIGIFFF